MKSYRVTVGVIILLGFFGSTNYALQNDRPLIDAAKRGNLLRIEELLSEYDINQVDSRGNAALHYAAKAGYYDVIEALVEHGAEVNYTNNKGETPIALAIRFRHEPVVAYFLTLPQINLDIRDETGLAPRDYLRQRLRVGKTLLKEYDIARLSKEQQQALAEWERKLRAGDDDWVLVGDNNF